MELATLTAKIEQHTNRLKEFTETPGAGVTRFPFTTEAKQAVDYLLEAFKMAGLEAHMDGSGSVIGRLEGESQETIMIGSHYDSVQHGGAYDGMAGAICGLEALRLIKEEGIKPKYSLEVVATNDEEGARFKSGLFSAKAYLGQFTPEKLKQFTDKDGISIYEAMEGFGLDPEKIEDVKRNDIRKFVEVHIEQGPVMEAEQKEIGIVSTIVGIKRVMVTIHGREDHVGTMPMNMRKDALEMATKVIADIGDGARGHQDAVATVGNLNVYPNIINIVPKQVTFSVDFRGTTAEVIDGMYEAMVARIEEVTAQFGGSYELQETLDSKPVEMNSRMKEMIEESCKKHDFSYMTLISGAGHDALVMGEEIDTAMIFVPSFGGRSHCQEEFTEGIHLAQATIVARDLIRQLCNE